MREDKASPEVPVEGLDPQPSRGTRPRKRRRKGVLVRGMVTLLPAVLTIFVFVTLLQFVDRYLASPINRVISASLEGNGLGWKVLDSMGVDPYDVEFVDEDLLPVDLRESARREGLGSASFQARLSNWREGRADFFRDYEKLAIDRERVHEKVSVPAWIGPALSVLLVLVLGYLAGGFLGRSLIASVDRTLTSLPIVKSVYPYTKQIVDFFLSDKELEFDTVVAAPYPSSGLWAIGFVTGNGLKTINEALGGKYLSVFIPTSPMPMTGYTVFFPAERLIPLSISVDEAIRVVVSAGVVVPPSESIEALQGEIAELGRQADDAEGATRT